MKNRIHEKLCTHQEELQSWYRDRLEGQYVPFYASFDIRDGGFKIGNVDGNIFPAGFNNICQVDKDSAPEIITGHLQTKFPGTKKILLLTEDHLKNVYYWENAITIKELLLEAGYQVNLGMLSPDLENQVELESFSGKKVTVEKVFSDSGQLVTANFQPDLVISNNDFSQPYSDVDFSKTLMTPMRDLGWFQRKKNTYFCHYNKMVHEFAEILKEDPWLFQVQTKKFTNFDINSEDSRNELGIAVDGVLGELKNKYQDNGVEDEPFVFVKNDSGTYGLGVVTASRGQDVVEWNYKARKKMKATKGGGGFTDVIIQEGIPSVLTEAEATAEPVVYMVGSELVGGFLRTHKKKDGRESLNSPGAVYQKLCLSDLRVKAEGSMLENVYGWVAKLGLLAISREGAALK